jgi:hypothetical protein
MSRRFGFDFSRVRIHHDPEAAHAATELHARAYTMGEQIGFAAGRYNPRSAQGRQLLGHELAHVVQQHRASGITASGGVASRDSAGEREANGAARSLISGGPMPMIQALPTPGPQLQAEDENEQVEGGEEREEEDEVADGDMPTVGNEVTDTDAEKEAASAEEKTQLQAGLDDKGQPKDKPKTPPPPKITKIDVNLSSQTMDLTYDNGKVENGIVVSTGKGLPNTKDDPCKNPNVDGSNCTPDNGPFTVGKRGDAQYRNTKGDRMSWYVEFERDRAIGIHDSQPVTGKPASHGCVRVSETWAKHINQRVIPGTTIVVVSGKAPTKSWSKSKPKPKPAPKKKK